MVDPWEARYNDRPINFTDVIQHIKFYLKKFLNLNVEVAYVFGSDNDGFARAFLKSDYGVCFERPGFETSYERIKKDSFVNKDRIYFMGKKNNFASSKSIRAGNYTYIPEKIKELYFKYRGGAYPVTSKFYLIRDDYVKCSENIPCNDSDLRYFKNEFLEVFKRAFSGYQEIEFIFLDVDLQNRYLNSDVFNGKKIINADLWTFRDGQKTVGVSRLFDLSDAQVFSSRLVERSGFKKIEDQLSMIDPGDYIFVDDDMASGKTLGFLRSNLPEGVNISEVVALSQNSFHGLMEGRYIYHFHDIVDLRDFMIGSYGGGLMVELFDGSYGRVPYMWPYVNLSFRAKIPHDFQKQFSLDLWKMNRNFFGRIDRGLVLKNLNKDFVNVVYSLGFDLDLLVTEFCDFHIEKLEKL
jgi:hypothetical protein